MIMKALARAPLYDSSSSEDAEFALRQLNLQVKGLIPGQKDANIWAGKRYYQRQDVFLWDYYYLDISGSGAGIENLKVGPGNLSLAWTRKTHDGQSYELTKSFDRVEAGDGDLNINYFDARYGASLWNGGWTELCVTIESPNKPDNADYNHFYNKDGELKGTFSNGTSTLVTGNIVFSGSWGWNKTTLQWGNKGWTSGSSWYNSWSDASNAWEFRVINQGELQFGNFHLLHAARYFYYDYDPDTYDTKTDDKYKELAFTVRPSYQLSQYTRLIGEVGLFWGKNEKVVGDDTSTQQQKYTLAYAIAPAASLLARPELRFYVSYIQSSNDAKSVSDRFATGNTYNSGVNFGVQAEAWW